MYEPIGIVIVVILLIIFFGAAWILPVAVGGLLLWLFFRKPGTYGGNGSQPW